MHAQPASQRPTHAIVVGGSITGLLAARILSDHFTAVTILERDAVHDAPETRKGQPHTRHLHALLAKGLQVMQQYFPGLAESLQAQGARIGDMGAMMRWHVEGGYRMQTPAGLPGALLSRPLLEWEIRRRVLALPNVRLIDACAAESLVFADDCARVTGVRATRRMAGGDMQVYQGDLVVETTGRGSSAGRWLEQAGYQPPDEDTVTINMGYATRMYRRQPGDLEGAELVIISNTPPHGKRGALIFPIEGDRWICTLGGHSGDHPPTDEQGFLAFAQSLAAPDIYQMLTKLEPVSEIVAYKFAGSRRMRYEKLARFPEGYLVLGDALCSFNPMYGQGMTVAAMEAELLDRLLTARPADFVAGLWCDFFRQAAAIVDIPWQMAAGQDFRFPETEGEKGPQVDFVNSYMVQLNRATHHDPVVYCEFLKVMNLMQPPTTLFHPAIEARVLQPAAAATKGAERLGALLSVA